MKHSIEQRLVDNGDGGPAFARSGFEAHHDFAGKHDTEKQNGMSLRDYFAAKAMPIAATFYDTNDEVCAEAATWCYRMADAMLAARLACKATVPEPLGPLPARTTSDFEQLALEMSYSARPGDLVRVAAPEASFGMEYGGRTGTILEFAPPGWVTVLLSGGEVGHFEKVRFRADELQVL